MTPFDVDADADAVPDADVEALGVAEDVAGSDALADAEDGEVASTGALDVMPVVSTDRGRDERAVNLSNVAAGSAHR